jgi:hypothetical protein
MEVTVINNKNRQEDYGRLEDGVEHDPPRNQIKEAQECLVTIQLTINDGVPVGHIRVLKNTWSTMAGAE